MVLFTGKFLLDLLCAYVSCAPTNPGPEIADSSVRSSRDINVSLATATHRETYPVVLTQNGKVQGYTQTSSEGRPFYAFEGIPFAQPPVGNLRFRDPVPAKPWKGIKRAMKSNMCVQIHPMQLFRVTGQEDCLRVNIYTPKVLKQAGQLLEASLPVIILIHGGSFIFGGAAEMGASYLLNQDVVVVGVNYRLGPLGFMSTGDDASPGNYGLKDQAMAIQWTIDNIGAFGGNSSHIFLVGYSAGGVSVHHQLIYNKKSRESFKGGLSLSGSAFVHWAIQQPVHARQLTDRMGRLMRCPVEDSHKLMECLRSKNPHMIVAQQLNLMDIIPFPPVLFVPVLETNSSQPLITELPEAVYARGDVAPVPWVTSVSLNEGHLALYFLKLMGQYNNIKRNFDSYAASIFNYRYLLKTQNLPLSDIAEKMKTFYFNGRDPREASYEELSDIFTDRYFYSGFERSLNIHGRVAPAYGYLITFPSKYNTGKYLNMLPTERGVAHAEDMAYYTNMSGYSPGFRHKDPEYKLSQILINFLTNLVTTGVPTYTDNNNNNTIHVWDAVTSGATAETNILKIDEDIEMIAFPFRERTMFWESLNLQDTPANKNWSPLLKGSLKYLGSKSYYESAKSLLKIDNNYIPVSVT